MAVKMHFQEKQGKSCSLSHSMMGLESASSFLSCNSTDLEQMEGAQWVEMPEQSLIPQFSFQGSDFQQSLAFCDCSNEVLQEKEPWAQDKEVCGKRKGRTYDAEIDI